MSEALDQILDRIMDGNQEVVAQAAVILGLIAAGEEAREEYGAEEDYPEPLKKFLDRAVEVAEGFINRVVPL